MQKKHQLNTKELLQKYSELSQVDKFTQSVGISKTTTLQGLKGSAAALFIGACFQRMQQTFVVVQNDKETAAYLYNDLQEILGKHKVEFLPTSYRRSVTYGSVSNENILLRTDVLSKFANHNKANIMVTYPEALMEKVIAPKSLESNTFTINKGDKFSMDFIVEMLAEYEFERVDFVYEPGQYAVRGSLIDVFSFAGDEPFRIDFFGDEIDNLRVFDTETQLTKSEPDSMVIIPNIQESLQDETRITLADFLPQNTCWCFADFDFCKSKIADVYKQAEPNQENIQQLVANADELEKSFAERSLVIFDQPNAENQNADIQFSMSLQPLVKKNFKLLSDVLNEFSEKEYTNYLLSANADQIERLQAIFDDGDLKATFTPLSGTLSQGFIDHDLKIACFTDHQIFERYHKFNIKTGFTKKETITIAELNNLHIGDYVVHIDHGIGKFGGLQKIEINGKHQESVNGFGGVEKSENQD